MGSFNNRNCKFTSYEVTASVKPAGEWSPTPKHYSLQLK
jgi:hypothetical protein